MKVIDKVTPEKAQWAADQFIDYFKNFSSIEDYLRYAKSQAVSNEARIQGISDKDAFFNEAPSKNILHSNVSCLSVYNL